MEEQPIDRAGALALARAARRFLVKTGDRVVAVDRPVSDTEAESLLVHEDGFLRVPVLVVGDLLVRGFTEELYRRAMPAGAG